MPKQTQQARHLMAQQGRVYVTDIVQVEMVWVLQRAYDFAKSDLIMLLEHLSENRAFVLENEMHFSDALEIYRMSNIDFSDALILAKSRAQNLSLLTFDRKLSQQNGVELLNH